MVACSAWSASAGLFCSLVQVALEDAVSGDEANGKVRMANSTTGILTSLMPNPPPRCPRILTSDFRRPHNRFGSAEEQTVVCYSAYDAPRCRTTSCWRRELRADGVSIQADLHQALLLYHALQNNKRYTEYRGCTSRGVGSDPGEHTSPG